jgi:tetratricopeptide (TPR) repeat protein
MAGLHVEQGAVDEGARELAEIWNADVAFLQVNAPMFVAGLSAPRLLQLQEALENGRANGNIPESVTSLFEKGSALSRAAQKPKATGSVDKPTWPLNQSAATLYASGKYRECTDLLVAQFHSLQVTQVNLLADCAYSSAAFQVTFTAAEKLVLNQATEAEGLYWEIRSVQKLAGEALAHASELNSDSPMLHVLLGDIYRQRKYWPDAQNEYRKALALKPEDDGALFGLSLALLADGKTDRARELSEASLRKSPDDPEFNAVMGEILSAQHDFSGAEPYLKKALNTKPELVPHVHALLGRVYSETGRAEQAIAEFRMGLADDKDGRIHFQLGRVYLKLGDRESAQKAFEVSERLRREGLTRAEVAMQQGENSDESR